METDEPTEFPSPFPSAFPSPFPTDSPTVSPSAPATTTNPPTAAPPTSEPSMTTTTALPSQNEEEAVVPPTGSTGTNVTTDEDTDDIGVETNQRTLLPFSIVVLGSVDEGRSSVRSLLQEYLTTYLQGPPQALHAVATIQLEEVDASVEDAQDDAGNRRRELQIGQQQQQQHLIRGRHSTSRLTRTLQGFFNEPFDGSTSASISSTTVLQYTGLVYLKDDDTDGGDFFDSKPSKDQIQEAQIAALEDTQALQDYFLDAVVPVQEEGEDGGDDDEDSPAQDPVVLLQVQVDGRPEVEQDPTTTLQTIESPAAGNDGDNTTNGDNDSTNNNDSSNSNSGSAWIIGLATGIALIGVAIIGSLCLLWRRKRKGGTKMDALEIISDVDSNEHMDDIVYDKSILQVATTRSTESGGERFTKDQGLDVVDMRSTTSATRSSGVGFSVFASKANIKDSASPKAKDEKDALGVNGRGGSRSLYSGKSFGDASSRESLDGMEIVHNSSSRGKRSPVVIDLTTGPKHARGIEGVEEEAPPVLALPPDVLLQSQAPLVVYKLGSTNTALSSPRDLDELDSVVAKMNIHSLTSYDDESMMGYSLASSHEHEMNTKAEEKSSMTNNGATANADQHGGNVGGIHHGSKESDIKKQKFGNDDDDDDDDNDEDEMHCNSFTDGDEEEVMNENENAEMNKVVSDTSSQESDTRQNPLFAGVQNLLNSSMDTDKSGKKKSASREKKKRWYDQLRLVRKERPQGFWSSDSESNRSLGIEPVPTHWVTPSDKSYPPLSGKSGDDHASAECDDNISIEVEASSPVVILNNPDSDDEASSSYKEGDSVKGSGSSVMSGYSSAQSSDASPTYNRYGTKTTGPASLSALGYFRHKTVDGDGHRGLSGPNLLAEISPAPSEEMDSMFSHNDVAPLHASPAVVSGDDFSDAPSDERHEKVSPSLIHEGRFSASDSNSHVVPLDTSADTDPAVVEYLMKERRNMKQRTRRKRADRKQPPVTMEV